MSNYYEDYIALLKGVNFLSELNRTPGISRRELLKAAGGVTFLALIATSEGMFAPVFASHKPTVTPALPLFTALPYLQPGTSSGKLVTGKEGIVIAWQTNSVKAEFTLEYGSEAAY